ncbi:MAG: hypothetical protein K8S23_05980 [Candidatus Cloacimonetes bacterium]|nr:hypothetical protein [Candidatus Cloacimonadota bacterium]
MKAIIKLVLLMCLIGLFIWSCTDDQLTNDEMTDEEALNLLITDNQSYFETEDHYGEEDTTEVQTEFRDPLNTFFWFRNLQSASITINISIDGDSAFVVFSGDYEGILNLYASQDTIELHTKNFVEHSIRNAIFKRLEDAETDPLKRRGWRLTEVSGAETGPGDQTVRIDSVRLNCDSYPDTIFTNPLELFSIEDLITLYPQERCSLTVYTNFDENVEHDFVFLHSWRRFIQHFRARFDFVEDGVYSGVWYAPANTANALNTVHHAAFDIINNETLLDDEIPYNSNAWTLPYKVSTE